MVKVFQTFAAERQLRRLVPNMVIESAADYYPQPGDADYKKNDDSPWIRRFAKAGGKVIICNDGKMMRVPHERLALVETKLVVVFFEDRWNQLKFTAKCAHLLLWWERVVTTVQHSAAPAFWRVPQTWALAGKLRKESHEDQAKLRIERQKAAQPRVAAQRAAKRLEKRPSPLPLLDYKPESEPAQ